MCRRFAIALFTCLALSAGGASAQEKKPLPKWTSTLECLAPLAREARGGEGPIQPEQVFFDGPFSLPIGEEPSIDRGFEHLLEGDYFQANQHFRALLQDADEQFRALMGLTSTHAGDRRRTKFFYEAVAAHPEASEENNRQWIKHLASSHLSTNQLAAANFGDSAETFPIQASMNWHMILVAMNDLYNPGQVYADVDSFLGLFVKERVPQALRFRAEAALHNSKGEEGWDLLQQSIDASARRLEALRTVMPEASNGIGASSRRLLARYRLAHQDTEHDALADRILAMPRDLNSIGTRWHRLTYEDSPWVVARRAKAALRIERGNWAALADLPRGFSSRDKADWFAWQVIAQRELEADFNLWLAALRRETDGKALIGQVENYLAWKDGEEIEERIELPSVPERFFTEEDAPTAAPAPTTQLADSPPATLSLPTFTLPDWQEKPIALADFAGKPVVVIFFLGGGCLHCVEQLTAFGPWAERYREAGIELLAVSTDESEILSYSLAENPDRDTVFPIPIVSDHTLEFFKKWHVYDEFDERAIHGTFVLNPAQEVIWHETGNTPYMHPDYLLHEAKRLLDR